MKTDTTPAFQIGDTAWLATYEINLTHVKCPDCFGKRFLTVTLGDDSQVAIDCAGCSAGFEPPQGVIERYEHSAKVQPIVIDGMEMGRGRETRYHYGSTSCSSRIADTSNLFATKEEAEAQADKLKAEATEAERKNFENSKDHTRRTWAWNATYHRRELARAKKDMERHAAKLNIAERKAQAEKEATQ